MAKHGAISEERILNAALKVVARKTISGTRMQLIADEAELLPSHIQYYFRTKNELMMALLEGVLQYFRDEREKMLKKSGATLGDKLYVFFRQKIKSLTGKKDYETVNVDFWVQNLVDKRINRQFRKNYEGWRGCVREVLESYLPDLEPELLEYIPYAMVSMMLGSTLQYYVQEGEMDLDAYFSVCLTLIMNTVEQGAAPAAPPAPGGQSAQESTGD